MPTSRVLADGTFEYGPPQSGTQLLTAALAGFDSAITVAVAAGADGETALHLARIGNRRALLDLGNYAGAAAAVAAVPSDYEYDIQQVVRSCNRKNVHAETLSAENDAEKCNGNSKDFGVVDGEARCGGVRSSTLRGAPPRLRASA